MRRAVAPLIAVTVALVLADSAIVTLALPDILLNLDTTVAEVAWVLISFNLVLGLVAVPTAVGFRRAQPRLLGAGGIAVFAAASAWCAVARSIELLIAARCVQALGGALALVGCLEILVALYGERRGIATWISAGVIGTATGPVAGGLLTQAFSWQAIFVVQVPFAVLAVPAALAVRSGPLAAPPAEFVRHRPAVRANLTLALLSAALTAALFLLVLLLVNGWGQSPAAAALTVSVVPVAALAARPLVRLLRPSSVVEVGVGCFLVAGGLAGLAVLPSAELAWTVAPQALIGLGLGLTVDQLTVRAMHLRLPRVEHASWTISARHLGVVVGLAILTPIFTADLMDAQVPAEQAITALVLDAPLPAQDKVALARALGEELTEQQGQVPDLHDAFAAADISAEFRPAAAQLEQDLDAQLERAATHAFRDSFLAGALLALLALLTVAAPPWRRTP
ncbi:MFS transporter [Nocardioides sp. MAH-18]|uniref:MFS transporter n=1 Tax=Nocardioides agri TaxID=2682843 RepID=A0A6L6XX14_9ACTN|nr:MFS transporter [Nocardioides sp. CGMCC 1.13656]MBA2952597.1 MFS transporter [Nocardioides sp. CGMCC 1.13656]MVQ51759.1 MFS transporter [Nocardioides sp. MAH-18]